jgi:hypothetical protein
MCEDPYEAGPIITIGGPTGTYVIRSPWNTECEYALYLVSANGSGIAVLSASNNSLLQITANPPTIGSTANGMDTNVLEAPFILLAANLFLSPPLHWQPLGRGANLYLAQTLASGNAYFNIAFRRLAKQIIPRLAPFKPHTHVPLSGKMARTFYEGYDEAHGRTIIGAPTSDPAPKQDTGTFRGQPAYNSRADNNPMSNLDRKAKRNG